MILLTWMKSETGNAPQFLVTAVFISQEKVLAHDQLVTTYICLDEIIHNPTIVPIIAL